MYWRLCMYILPFMTDCDLNRCFSNEYFLQDSKVSKIHSKSQSHTASAFTKHIYIYICNVGNAQNIAFPRSQKMPTSKTMMAHQILKVICFPKPSRQRKTTNRHCNSKLVSNSLFSWLLVTLVTCPIMDVYLDCFPGLYVARNETQVIFSPNKLCFTADMGM